MKPLLDPAIYGYAHEQLDALDDFFKADPVDLSYHCSDDPIDCVLEPNQELPF